MQFGFMNNIITDSLITTSMFYLSIVTTVILVLYYYFTRTFDYWNNKNVKGPKPMPFFGNFKDIALRKKPRGLLYQEIYKEYPKEKIVGFYQMTSPTLLIRDLDIVKQVMVKDFELFPDRGTYFSKEGLGENIFHSQVDTWKVLRNKFTSVFTSSKFRSIFHLLVDRGDKFIDYVDNLTMKHTEQDVYQIIFKYTVATSMITTFGWDINIFNDNPGWFEVLDDNLNSSHWQELDMIFPGVLTKFNLTVLAEKTMNICRELVKACVDQPMLSNNADIFNVKDVLMNLRKANDITKNHTINNDEISALTITDNLLAGQVWVFYTAGYLNNTLTLTYAMYHLARNPDIQEKVREEIDDVLEKHDGNLTYEALKEMKYLEMVFEETLRMHPLTQGLARAVSKNVKLEGTDVTLDKGSLVIISPYSIHYDEKYYPEPYTFDPERFLPKNVMNRHPCAFLSFGAGRRSCMGSQFARLQFGICVVKLLSQFRVEPSENTCKSINFDVYHMLLKPEHGIRLKFVPRVK